jgi:hypothetical protein
MTASEPTTADGKEESDTDYTDTPAAHVETTAPCHAVAIETKRTGDMIEVLLRSDTTTAAVLLEDDDARALIDDLGALVDG